MKRYCTLLSVFFLTNVAFANWTDMERQKYVNLMFNTAMKNKTYDEILSTKESLYTIYCIGDFYEDNYSYNEFLDMFYNGPDIKVDEFNKVSEICINLVKTGRTLEPKHYY
tara:strand:- start:54 stop:386 length:333 start_codon:yes stop_codon:yes gene_type:complete